MMMALSPFKTPYVLRFAKFCFVGTSGLLVDMAMLYLFTEPQLLGWNVTLGKICAAALAMLNNYLWNELWTFKPLKGAAEPARCLWRRFLLFHAICGFGIPLALALLHFFHSLLQWNLYLSNFLAIMLVTLWNFTLNARFNWRTNRKAAF